MTDLHSIRTTDEGSGRSNPTAARPNLDRAFNPLTLNPVLRHLPAACCFLAYSIYVPTVESARVRDDLHAYLLLLSTLLIAPSI